MSTTQDSILFQRRASATFLWAGLSASILIYGIVMVGSRELNLSLFDVALPTIVIGLFLWKPGDIKSLITETGMMAEARLAIAAIGLIAIHVCIHLIGPFDPSHTGLFRESLKSAGFFGQFLLLVILFKVFLRHLPSIRILSILIAVVALVAITRHVFEIYGGDWGLGSWFLPRNLHLALIATLLICSYAAYVGASPDQKAKDRHFVIAVHIISTATAYILFNKAMVILLVGILPILWLRVSIRNAVIALALAAGLALTLTISLSALTDFAFFKGVDSLGESTKVRIAMWDASLKAGAEAFPWGIGLGQLPPILSQVPEGGLDVDIGSRIVRVQNVYLPHNVFIAHFSEMGLLGLIFSACLIGLVVKACRRFPTRLAIAAGLLVAAPMMLQDALGLRAIPVLLALACVLPAGSAKQDSGLA